MTENPEVRYVDTGSATLDDVEIERLHEDFEIEMSRAAIAPDACVLELGYGHAHFMDWAKNRGWTVVGIEINPALHAAASSAGHDVHLGSLEDVDFPAGTAFDAVVAFDVFEHLTIAELTATLNLLHKLLAPGGAVFARFPNGGSPFGLAFMAGDITHRTALNGSAMEQLGALTGFSLELCENAARTVSGRRAKFLKRVAFKVCDLIEVAVGVLYFRGRRMPLDPDLVCVLRRQD
jgi:SAM-dependent methyltransferase